MFLNHDEIKEEIEVNSLINNYNLSRIDNASYRCAIGKIIIPSDKKERQNCIDNEEKFKLSPSEIVIVETFESVDLPSNYGCLYSIMQSRAKEGLLLLNSSMVEPNYKGKLSCYIINISQRDILLYKGLDLVKINFFEVKQRKDAKRLEIDDESYTNKLQVQSLNFGESFLDIIKLQNNAADIATKKVNGSLKIGGIVLAVLLVFSSLLPLIDNLVTKKWFNDYRNEVQIIKKMDKLEEENLELKSLILKNKAKVDSLNNY